MGLHPYCIVADGKEPPPGLRGLRGAAVEGVPVDGLMVWCSHAERRPAADLHGVRAHDRVIRAATDAGTPLPIRFGQWCGDREALAAEVRAGARGYREALERIAGAVEFAVRIDLSGPFGSAGDAGSASEPELRPDRSGRGAAYLRELARRQAGRTEARRRGDDLLAELHRSLEGRIRRARLDPVPARGSLASGAHLVSREDVDAYGVAVRRFTAERPHLRVRVTGPWPPYSFT